MRLWNVVFLLLAAACVDSYATQQMQTNTHFFWADFLFSNEKASNHFCVSLFADYCCLRAVMMAAAAMIWRRLLNNASSAAAALYKSNTRKIGDATAAQAHMIFFICEANKISSVGLWWIAATMAAEWRRDDDVPHRCCWPVKHVSRAADCTHIFLFVLFEGASICWWWFLFAYASCHPIKQYTCMCNRQCRPWDRKCCYSKK